MNRRTLLILLLMLFTVFTIIVIGLMAVYKYEPTYLGLPPHPVDSTELAEEIVPEIIIPMDTVKLEPKIALSLNEYEKLQAAYLKAAVMMSENQIAENRKQHLIDSLLKVYKNLRRYNDSVKVLADTIRGAKTDYATLYDSLQKLNKIHMDSISKLRLANKTIDKQAQYIERTYDSLELKNFETFAKIYNTSNPADVARILEQIDEKDASMILKMMSRKKAGKVLEVMIPEQAAAIMLLGAEK